MVCDACRCSGHLASQCDMLAMAIFIEKYKRGTLADKKDRIKAAWLKKHKVALGNPSRNPRWVMKMYIDLLDTTMDEVDAQMCWDCWPEDDDLQDGELSL